MVPLTICCLALAAGLGLGTGAVFKLVLEETLDDQALHALAARLTGRAD